jgi:transposase
VASPSAARTGSSLAPTAVGERAASTYTLIATAKLNDIDPQAWLADVLRRIADHPARRLHELLPWNWHLPTAGHAVAA